MFHSGEVIICKNPTSLAVVCSFAVLSLVGIAGGDTSEAEIDWQPLMRLCCHTSQVRSSRSFCLLGLNTCGTLVWCGSLAIELWDTSDVLMCVT